MVFPLGLGVLRKNSPGLMGWAWAVNGYFSVLGSVAAVIAAMGAGFSGVLILAAAVYGVGLWIGPREASA